MADRTIPISDITLARLHELAPGPEFLSLRPWIKRSGTSTT